jgi:hypothetical protein
MLIRTRYGVLVRSELQLAHDIQVNLFRVAFLLERMCPIATGLGSTFNETVSLSPLQSSSQMKFRKS